ncbi:ComF family protein [Spirochaeta cellobiosiphila]|uniref:ComF family protein n=1 Tax=Spirochaeta cellobiosiphila TaxID=504483 RepID=UPI00040AD56E|nr:phosphoribosyltransferase family protein [Spirochaeta cellobiosiphila]
MKIDIFPQYCELCGSLIDIGTHFCDGCAIPNGIFRNNFCKNCGIILPSPLMKKCSSCSDSSNYNTYFLMSYEGSIKLIIQAFKNVKEDRYCKYLADLFIRLSPWIYSYDIIIPAPSKRNILTKKGSFIDITKYMAKHFDLNIVYLLKKIKNTQQKKLSLQNRHRNLISVDKYKIQKYMKYTNKRICIIDDIYTTGNTIKQCVSALKSIGFNNIDVITLCRD